MPTPRRIHPCRPLIGPLDPDVFKEIPSLQLHAPFDEKARGLCENESPEHHKTVVSRAQIVRRSLIVLVGVPIGIVSVGLKCGIHYIWNFRVRLVLGNMRSAADGDDSFWHILAALVVGAFLTVSTSMVAACFVAWKPAAASSGIPKVIAFLNGVDLQTSLGAKVLLAKIVGTAFAVGSGLAVGPEGPMIYIGACFGTVVVRKVLRPLLRRVWAEVEDELTHDSLTYNVQAAAMGAGAGIAAAFHAPLAGTIFVVEEAASFFSKKLFLHTFLTCMTSVFTVELLEFALGLDKEQYYSGSPICISDIQLSALLVFQVVSVSAACAVLAIAFNRVVVFLNAWRALATKELGKGTKLYYNQFKGVFQIALLCGSLPVLWIASMPCQDCSLQTVFRDSNGCIPNEWLPQIFKGTTSTHQGDVGANIHSRHRDNNPLVFAFEPMPFLFGAQYSPITCPLAIGMQRKCRIKGIEQHLSGSTWNASHYCCAFTNRSELHKGRFANYSSPLAPLEMSEEQWPRASCPHGRQDPNTGVSVEQYSPLAALFLAQPNDVVRSILVRGAPNILPVPDMAAFLVLYTSLVVVSTTAWVPGGLLVPMMIIGSAAGRLGGLLWEWGLGAEARNFRTSIVWTPEYRPLVETIHPGAEQDPKPGLPVEPGVLALAGCAAFLSGSGSIVFFVLVLLIEITLEPFLFMIVVIAVIVSRSIVVLARCGGVSEGGLYHELINVQSLPYLHQHTHWRQGHHVVEDLLNEDLRIRQEAAAVSMPELYAAALDTLPDDFQSSNFGVKVVRRRTTIAEVKKVLEYCLPGDDHPMINGFPVVEEGGQLTGLVTRKELERLVEKAAGSPHGTEVSLDDVSVDNAPFVIQGHKPVLHAHALISGCGARHVVVVDGANKPIGVITRKSLMPWRTPMPSHDTDIASPDSFASLRAVYRSSISASSRSGLSEQLRSPPLR